MYALLYAPRYGRWTRLNYSDFTSRRATGYRGPQLIPIASWENPPFCFFYFRTLVCGLGCDLDRYIKSVIVIE